MEEPPAKEILETEKLLAYHPGDTTGMDYLQDFQSAGALQEVQSFARAKTSLLFVCLNSASALEFCPEKSQNP